MNLKTIFLALFLFAVTTIAWYRFKQSIPQQPIKQPVVLFDFDGTLADSFEVAVEICNELAPTYGFKAITPEEKLKIPHMSMRELITDYLKIPWYKVPFLHRRALKLYGKYRDQVMAIKDIQAAVKEVKAHGYSLGVVTSNSEENVRHFLVKNDLNFFDVIFAKSSLFGKHRTLKQFMNSFNISTKNVVYVGDEARDIEAAHRVGIRIISVGWGFNSEQRLRAQNPDIFISRPSELLGAINRLFEPKS